MKDSDIERLIKAGKDAAKAFEAFSQAWSDATESLIELMRKHPELRDEYDKP